MKTITKEIKIDAPKERVWHILLEDNFNRMWLGEFSKGSRAETDWIEGHKVKFVDDSSNGITGKITAKQPYDLLEMTYDGLIVNGKEDYDSEIANIVKGAKETYKLSEEGGGTRLNIACDMDESHFDIMSEAWDRALAKIKELAMSV